MKICNWLVWMLMVGWMFGAAEPIAAQEQGLLYAHRGGALEFEENTMAAFRGSYEKGLRGFETDVRMTKDGELVVLHDDSLNRTHTATGAVEHKTAAELRSVTTRKDGQAFLFLDELLAFFADKPGIYLELEMKTGNKELYPDARLEVFCRKLHDAVQARQPKESFYQFTSFDERPLKIIKKLDDTANLVLITGGPCSPEFVTRARELGVKRVSCNLERLSRAAVRDAQKAGLRVNGWTGRSLHDYHLAVGLSLDGICTDVPVAVQTWKATHE